MHGSAHDLLRVSEGDIEDVDVIRTTGWYVSNPFMSIRLE